MTSEDKLIEIFKNVTTDESAVYLSSFGYLFDNFEFLKDEPDDFMDRVNPDMLKALEEYIPSIIDDDDKSANFMIIVIGVLTLKV